MEKLEKKISEIQLSHLRLNSGGNISLRSIEDSGLQIASEVKDIAIAFADYCNKYSFDPNILAPSSYDELFTDFIINYDKQ